MIKAEILNNMVVGVVNCSKSNLPFQVKYKCLTSFNNKKIIHIKEELSRLWFDMEDGSCGSKSLTLKIVA